MSQEKDIYEVYIISWYQETPLVFQEEVMHQCDNIDDAWDFVKQKADEYIEWYPLVGIGIRIKESSSQ